MKADISEAGEGWSDSRIIKALDTSASMVYRVRHHPHLHFGLSEPRSIGTQDEIAHHREPTSATQRQTVDGAMSGLRQRVASSQ